MHKYLVIVISDFFHGLKLIQLNQEGNRLQLTKSFVNHLNGCFDSSTCCQKIIYDENTLTRLTAHQHAWSRYHHRTLLIASAEMARQFPGLRTGAKPPQLRSNWAAHDKSREPLGPRSCQIFLSVAY